MESEAGRLLFPMRTAPLEPRSDVVVVKERPGMPVSELNGRAVFGNDVVCFGAEAGEALDAVCGSSLHTAAFRRASSRLQIELTVTMTSSAGSGGQQRAI